MQSASLEQVSRSAADTEPSAAEADLPVPDVPPVAGVPPTPLSPAIVAAPPLPEGDTTTPTPPTPDESPSGACNPKGVREQAKAMRMSRARRFISTSHPRDLRERMLAASNGTIRVLAK
jgi:hypothetical protein